jgi:hypothetical protein
VARRGAQQEVDVSYQDRGGSVERATADHRIKAAQAERRAEHMGRDGANRSSRSGAGLAFLFGVAVCLASWAAFRAGAGSMGLQQSVTRYALDPLGFAASHPVAVAATTVIAFLVAYLFARVAHTSGSFARLAVGAVLLGNLVAAFVAAPLMVGELTVEWGPVVFLAISLYGLQPLAAWAGARLGATADARIVAPGSGTTA